MGSPVASFAEDGVAVGLSFSAILVPWLVAFMLLAMGAAVYRIVTTGRRRRQRKAAGQAEDRAAREAREREVEPWWRLFARGRED
jgi:flagellar biosynthesis/type III secretory pathway M-ring protein FliF/YscJ